MNFVQARDGFRALLVSSRGFLGCKIRLHLIDLLDQFILLGLKVLLFGLEIILQLVLVNSGLIEDIRHLSC